MNRVFKTVWNSVRRQIVVVSEEKTSQGRGAGGKAASGTTQTSSGSKTAWVRTAVSTAVLSAIAMPAMASWLTTNGGADGKLTWTVSTQGSTSWKKISRHTVDILAGEELTILSDRSNLTSTDHPDLIGSSSVINRGTISGTWTSGTSNVRVENDGNYLDNFGTMKFVFNQTPNFNYMVPDSSGGTYGNSIHGWEVQTISNAPYVTDWANGKTAFYNRQGASFIIDINQLSDPVVPSSVDVSKYNSDLIAYKSGVSKDGLLGRNAGMMDLQIRHEAAKATGIFVTDDHSFQNEETGVINIDIDYEAPTNSSSLVEYGFARGIYLDTSGTFTNRGQITMDVEGNNVNALSFGNNAATAFVNDTGATITADLSATRNGTAGFFGHVIALGSGDSLENRGTIEGSVVVTGNSAVGIEFENATSSLINQAGGTLTITSKAVAQESSKAYSTAYGLALNGGEFVTNNGTMTLNAVVDGSEGDLTRNKLAVGAYLRDEGSYLENNGTLTLSASGTNGQALLMTGGADFTNAGTTTIEARRSADEATHAALRGIVTGGDAQVVNTGTLDITVAAEFDGRGATNTGNPDLPAGSAYGITIGAPTTSDLEVFKNAKGAKTSITVNSSNTKSGLNTGVRTNGFFVTGGTAFNEGELVIDSTWDLGAVSSDFKGYANTGLWVNQAAVGSSTSFRNTGTLTINTQTNVTGIDGVEQALDRGALIYGRSEFDNAGTLTITSAGGTQAIALTVGGSTFTNAKTTVLSATSSGNARALSTSGSNPDLELLGSRVVNAAGGTLDLTASSETGAFGIYHANGSMENLGTITLDVDATDKWANGVRLGEGGFERPTLVNRGSITGDVRATNDQAFGILLERGEVVNSKTIDLDVHSERSHATGLRLTSTDGQVTKFENDKSGVIMLDVSSGVNVRKDGIAEGLSIASSSQLLNAGTITVNLDSHAHFIKGIVLADSTSVLKNTGTISITGTNWGDGTYEIESELLDGLKAYGAVLNDGEYLENEGNFNIHVEAKKGMSYGIGNWGGTFKTAENAVTDIKAYANDSHAYGIFLGSSIADSTGGNAGTLRIDARAGGIRGASAYGIRLGETSNFLNAESGLIDLKLTGPSDTSNAEANGIWIYQPSAIFTNAGRIDIAGTSSEGSQNTGDVNGIYLLQGGRFVNDVTGIISIEIGAPGNATAANNSGIQLNGTSAFDNRGSITINLAGNDGLGHQQGLWIVDQSVFTNHEGGSITVNVDESDTDAFVKAILARNGIINDGTITTNGDVIATSIRRTNAMKNAAINLTGKDSVSEIGVKLTTGSLSNAGTLTVGGDFALNEDGSNTSWTLDASSISNTGTLTSGSVYISALGSVDNAGTFNVTVDGTDRFGLMFGDSADGSAVLTNRDGANLNVTLKASDLLTAKWTHAAGIDLSSGTQYGTKGATFENYGTASIRAEATNANLYGIAGDNNIENTIVNAGDLTIDVVKRSSDAFNAYGLHMLAGRLENTGDLTVNMLSGDGITSAANGLFLWGTIPNGTSIPQEHRVSASNSGNITVTLSEEGKTGTGGGTGLTLGAADMVNSTEGNLTIELAGTGYRGIQLGRSGARATFHNQGTIDISGTGSGNTAFYSTGDVTNDGTISVALTGDEREGLLEGLRLRGEAATSDSEEVRSTFTNAGRVEIGMTEGNFTNTEYLGHAIGVTLDYADLVNSGEMSFMLEGTHTSALYLNHGSTARNEGSIDITANAYKGDAKHTNNVGIRLRDGSTFINEESATWTFTHINEDASLGTAYADAIITNEDDGADRLVNDGTMRVTFKDLGERDENQWLVAAHVRKGDTFENNGLFEIDSTSNVSAIATTEGVVDAVLTMGGTLVNTGTISADITSLESTRVFSAGYGEGVLRNSGLIDFTLSNTGSGDVIGFVHDPAHDTSHLIANEAKGRIEADLTAAQGSATLFDLTESERLDNAGSLTGTVRAADKASGILLSGSAILANDRTIDLTLEGTAQGSQLLGLSVSGSDATVTNSGSIRFTLEGSASNAYGIVGDSAQAVLTNAEGAELEITTNGSFADAAAIRWVGAVRNDGSITTNAGVDVGSLSGAGTLSVRDGAVKADTLSQSSVRLENIGEGSSIGSVAMAQGTFELLGTSSQLAITGEAAFKTLTNAGSLTIGGPLAIGATGSAGTLSNSGTLTLNENALVYGQLSNEGKIVAGDMTVNGEVFNAFGAQMQTGTLIVRGEKALTNEGEMTVADTSEVYGLLTNTGTIWLYDKTLVGEDGRIENKDLLLAQGTIEVNGLLVNLGVQKADTLLLNGTSVSGTGSGAYVLDALGGRAEAGVQSVVQTGTINAERTNYGADYWGTLTLNARYDNQGTVFAGSSSDATDADGAALVGTGMTIGAQGAFVNAGTLTINGILDNSGSIEGGILAFTGEADQVFTNRSSVNVAELSGNGVTFTQGAEGATLTVGKNTLTNSHLTFTEGNVSFDGVGIGNTFVFGGHDGDNVTASFGTITSDSTVTIGTGAVLSANALNLTSEEATVFLQGGTLSTTLDQIFDDVRTNGAVSVDANSPDDTVNVAGISIATGVGEIKDSISKGISFESGTVAFTDRVFALDLAGDVLSKLEADDGGSLEVAFNGKAAGTDEFTVDLANKLVVTNGSGQTAYAVFTTETLVNRMGEDDSNKALVIGTADSNGVHTPASGYNLIGGKIGFRNVTGATDGIFIRGTKSSDVPEAELVLVGDESKDIALADGLVQVIGNGATLTLGSYGSESETQGTLSRVNLGVTNDRYGYGGAMRVRNGDFSVDELRAGGTLTVGDAEREDKGNASLTVRDMVAAATANVLNYGDLTIDGLRMWTEDSGGARFDNYGSLTLGTSSIAGNIFNRAEAVLTATGAMEIGWGSDNLNAGTWMGTDLTVKGGEDFIGLFANPAFKNTGSMTLTGALTLGSVETAEAGGLGGKFVNAGTVRAPAELTVEGAVTLGRLASFENKANSVADFGSLTLESESTFTNNAQLTVAEATEVHGTLTLGAGSDTELGSLAVTNGAVANAGALVVNGLTRVGTDGRIEGDGSFTLENVSVDGTLTANGNLTAEDVTVAENASFSATGASNVLNSLTVKDGAALALGRGQGTTQINTLTISGAATTAAAYGTLTVEDALTLTGSNFTVDALAKAGALTLEEGARLNSTRGETLAQSVSVDDSTLELQKLTSETNITASGATVTVADTLQTMTGMSFTEGSTVRVNVAKTEGAVSVADSSLTGTLLEIEENDAALTGAMLDVETVRLRGLTAENTSSVSADTLEASGLVSVASGSALSIEKSLSAGSLSVANAKLDATNAELGITGDADLQQGEIRGTGNLRVDGEMKAEGSTIALTNADAQLSMGSLSLVEESTLETQGSLNVSGRVAVSDSTMSVHTFGASGAVSFENGSTFTGAITNIQGDLTVDGSKVTSTAATGSNSTYLAGNVTLTNGADTDFEGVVGNATVHIDEGSSFSAASLAAASLTAENAGSLEVSGMTSLSGKLDLQNSDARFGTIYAMGGLSVTDSALTAGAVTTNAFELDAAGKTASMSSLTMTDADLRAGTLNVTNAVQGTSLAVADAVTLTSSALRLGGLFTNAGSITTGDLTLADAEFANDGTVSVTKATGKVAFTQASGSFTMLANEFADSTFRLTGGTVRTDTLGTGNTWTLGTVAGAVGLSAGDAASKLVVGTITSDSLLTVGEGSTVEVSEIKLDGRTPNTITLAGGTIATMLDQIFADVKHDQALDLGAENPGDIVDVSGLNAAVSVGEIKNEISTGILFETGTLAFNDEVYSLSLASDVLGKLEADDGGDIEVLFNGKADVASFTVDLANSIHATKPGSGEDAYAVFASETLVNTDKTRPDANYTKLLIGSADGDVSDTHVIGSSIGFKAVTGAADGITIAGESTEFVLVGSSVEESLLLADGALSVGDGATLTFGSYGMAKATGGSFSAVAVDDATLRVRNGHFTGENVTVSASGTLLVGDAEHADRAAALDADVLDLSGRLTNYGSLTLQTLMQGASSTAENNGTLQAASADLSGTLTNAASAQLDFDTLSISGSLDNAGHLTTGSTDLSGSITNSGTIEAGRFAMTSGSFVQTANDADTHASSFTVSGGKVDIDAGTLTIDTSLALGEDATLTNSGTISAASATVAGFYTGAGNLNLTDSLTVEGTGRIEASESTVTGLKAFTSHAGSNVLLGALQAEKLDVMGGMLDVDTITGSVLNINRGSSLVANEIAMDQSINILFDANYATANTGSDDTSAERFEVGEAKAPVVNVQGGSAAFTKLTAETLNVDSGSIDIGDAQLTNTNINGGTMQVDGGMLGVIVQTDGLLNVQDASKPVVAKEIRQSGGWITGLGDLVVTDLLQLKGSSDVDIENVTAKITTIADNGSLTAKHVDSKLMVGSNATVTITESFNLGGGNGGTIDASQVDEGTITSLVNRGEVTVGNVTINSMRNEGDFVAGNVTVTGDVQSTGVFETNGSLRVEEGGSLFFASSGDTSVLTEKPGTILNDVTVDGSIVASGASVWIDSTTVTGNLTAEQGGLLDIGVATGTGATVTASGGTVTGQSLSLVEGNLNLMQGGAVTLETLNASKSNVVLADGTLTVGSGSIRESDIRVEAGAWGDALTNLTAEGESAFGNNTLEIAGGSVSVADDKVLGSDSTIRITGGELNVGRIDLSLNAGPTVTVGEGGTLRTGLDQIFTDFIVEGTKITADDWTDIEHVSGSVVDAATKVGDVKDSISGGIAFEGGELALVTDYYRVDLLGSVMNSLANAYGDGKVTAVIDGKNVNDFTLDLVGRLEADGLGDKSAGLVFTKDVLINDKADDRTITVGRGDDADIGVNIGFAGVTNTDHIDIGDGLEFVLVGFANEGEKKQQLLQDAVDGGTVSVASGTLTLGSNGSKDRTSGTLASVELDEAGKLVVKKGDFIVDRIDSTGVVNVTGTGSLTSNDLVLNGSTDSDAKDGASSVVEAGGSLTIVSSDDHAGRLSIGNGASLTIGGILTAGGEGSSSVQTTVDGTLGTAGTSIFDDLKIGSEGTYLTGESATDTGDAISVAKGGSWLNGGTSTWGTASIDGALQNTGTLTIGDDSVDLTENGSATDFALGKGASVLNLGRMDLTAAGEAHIGGTFVTGEAGKDGRLDESAHSVFDDANVVSGGVLGNFGYETGDLLTVDKGGKWLNHGFAVWRAMQVAGDATNAGDLTIEGDGVDNTPDFVVDGGNFVNNGDLTASDMDGGSVDTIVRDDGTLTNNGNAEYDDVLVDNGGHYHNTESGKDGGDSITVEEGGKWTNDGESIWGSVIVAGDATNTGDLTIGDGDPDTDDFIVEGSGSVTNDGKLDASNAGETVIEGDLTTGNLGPNGEIDESAESIFDNVTVRPGGSLTNNGTESGNDLTVEEDGEYVNNGNAGWGNITIEGGGSGSNSGNITVDDSFVVEEDGSFTNDGTINAGNTVIGGEFDQTDDGILNTGDLTVLPGGDLTLDKGEINVSGDMTLNGANIVIGNWKVLSAANRVSPVFNAEKPLDGKLWVIGNGDVTFGTASEGFADRLQKFDENVPGLKGAASRVTVGQTVTMGEGSSLAVGSNVWNQALEEGRVKLKDASLYFGHDSYVLIDIGSLGDDPAFSTSVAGAEAKIESGAHLVFGNLSKTGTFTLLDGFDLSANFNEKGDWIGGWSGDNLYTVTDGSKLDYFIMLDAEEGQNLTVTVTVADVSTVYPDIVLPGLGNEAMQDCSKGPDSSFICGIIKDENLSVGEKTTIVNSVAQIGAVAGAPSTAFSDAEDTLGVLERRLSFTGPTHKAGQLVKAPETAGLWVEIMGGTTRMTDLALTNLEGGVKSDASGVIVGADLLFPQYSMKTGVAFSYLTGTAKSLGNGLAATNAYDTLGAHGYFAWTPTDVLNVTGTLDWMRQAGDLTMGIGLEEIGKATADTTNDVFAANLRVETRASVLGAEIVPHAGLRAMYLANDTFETKIDGKAAFRNDVENAFVLDVPVGVSVKGYIPAKGGWIAEPSADVTYTSRFGKTELDTKLSGVSLTSTDTVTSDLVGKRFGEVHLGLDMRNPAADVTFGAELVHSRGEAGQSDTTYRFRFTKQF